MKKVNTHASYLFTLCTTNQWKEVTDIIHKHPFEAKQMLCTGKRGAAKISALQTVLAHPKCKGKVPISLVSALLKAAPEMAMQNHLYTGNYPLHAVFYNAFFSSNKRRIIAEMIMKSCPSAIYLRNGEGRTALSTNCSQHCNYEPTVILLKTSPQIVSWRDNNGDLPIHLACKSLKSPNKSIQLLFDLFPLGIFARNYQGHTPLEATISSGLPHHKLLPRIQFIRELEHLAKSRTEDPTTVNFAAPSRYTSSSDLQTVYNKKRIHDANSTIITPYFHESKRFCYHQEKEHVRNRTDTPQLDSSEDDESAVQESRQELEFHLDRPRSGSCQAEADITKLATILSSMRRSCI